MDQTYTKQKLKELRALVDEGDRVAIVLQDDPDPDAMASAMALRTLLGRNKLTTPLFSFKPVTRPENRTMVHLLEIDIEPAESADLDEYDKIAMVDVQPAFFGDNTWPWVDPINGATYTLPAKARYDNGTPNIVP